MSVPDGVEEEPVARAAMWYVAAFGGLAAALLAGTQWTGVDFERARNPILAVVSMVVAVGAASVVVFLATRVISPSVTIGRLQRREDRARRRAQRRSTGPPTWADIADRDRLLRELMVQDFVDETPTTLARRARAGDIDARDEVRELLVEANRRRARSTFRLLRITTLVAVAVVLAAAIVWSTSTQPSRADPTTRKPVAVSVVLSDTADPATVVGPGCTARQLDGVAVGGSFTGGLLVALPPQQDCPGRLVTLGPAIGTATRTPD